MLGTTGPASNSNCRVGVHTTDPNYNGGFGQTGFRPEYQDTNPASTNQVRHFAAWFAAGDFWGNNAITRGRLHRTEHSSNPNDPDVALGEAAIGLGASFPMSADYKKLAQDVWHQIYGQSGDLSLP